MIDMTVRDVQLNCLEMLKYFRDICSENGLNWYLSGGTLLGAVRHKGFIPWDDDVDVMMPRPDYDRLIALAPKLADGRFPLFHIGCDRIYHRSWARLMDKRTTRTTKTRYINEQWGTFIDIYPIDGAPAGKSAGEIYFLRMRFWDLVNKCIKIQEFQDTERLVRIIHGVVRHLDPIPFAKRMSRIPLRYSYERSPKRCVALACSHYWTREIMDPEVFDHAVDVEFEGSTMPAPCGWDTYLRNLYGDYMTIPEKYRNTIVPAFTHPYRYARLEEGETAPEVVVF